MKNLSIYALVFAFLLSFSVYAEKPVHGVEVTLTNTKTGKSYKTKTDRNGRYRFRKLPEGHYTLTVSANGQSMTVGKAKDERINIEESDDAADDMMRTKRKAKRKARREDRKIVKEIDKSSPKLAVAIKEIVKDGSDGKTSSSNDDNWNSTRSNKIKTSTDDDNWNTTRSNTMTGKKKKTKKSGSSSSASKKGYDHYKAQSDMSSAKPVLTVVVKDKTITGKVTLLK